MAMGKRAVPRWLDELAALVAELRRAVVSLKAENARLRAALAALGGEGEPASTVDGSDEAGEEPVARKAKPLWMKPNVVVVERHKPCRARQPVPGRHREKEDRQVVHAPGHCVVCASELRPSHIYLKELTTSKREQIGAPVRNLKVPIVSSVKEANEAAKNQLSSFSYD